ncbi:Z1 domain-containing protein [Nocardioides taihuensis]|uniref:Z1 domain-containing protein n=1 Tax=Nocardioides taihuensis TaxID=1835606 RepID=A0ABW0BLR8_9ACTN
MTSEAVAMMRQFLMDRMTRQREQLGEAAASLRRFVNDPAALDAAIAAIQADIDENSLLDSPAGVADRSLLLNVQMAPWYSGPEAGDLYWPTLRERLESGHMTDVVPDIDRASTKVVAQLSNPNIHNLKKLGLVLGYVQSGKTANFTAVMAKAADRGFGLFIVLSGIHNNLRQQTQVRIAKDLGLASGRWVSLTTSDGDFVNDPRHSGASQLRPDRPVVMVIKKNQHRLQGLKAWLEETPIEVRRRTPVLLLDDEADQATPNSARGRSERSAISKLTKDIWSLIPTGSYVGYTATPFANIFMDPNDDEGLYPAHFIIDLPQPDAYFGAERLFGREPLDNDHEPESGLDMVRDIPDAEAATLRPPTSRENRETWRAEIPPSLKEAVRWFVVATAIRRARGQDDHSSMLVHTTHYAHPHFVMREVISNYRNALVSGWRTGRERGLRESYESEANRASTVATEPLPSWSEALPHIAQVLDDLRVIVDNGSSVDRLNYDRVGPDGQPVKEVVIAVGGGTLSRGLTLEGLVVSYFTRTSNTYDTLLQMGRWFGYRPGYEDLPRLWLQGSLADDYRFLALVEAEIRQDIRDMEKQKITPRELGVRVRQHPGRLAIVARNKMGAAQLVRVSYAGERLQTFIFDRSVAVARENFEATRDFLAACRRAAELAHSTKPPRWRFRDVPASSLLSYLRRFSVHPDQSSMRTDYITGWIEEAVAQSLWNVTVIGSGQTTTRADGSKVELGSLDLGLGSDVPAVNRSPLKDSGQGRWNIKALLTHTDWFADLDASEVSEMTRQNKTPREIRRALASGRGQVLIYVVSKSSIPLSEASERSRVPMNAPEHLIGLGLIFPEVAEPTADGTYYAVKPDWQPELEPDDIDEIPPDNEGDAEAVVGAAAAMDEDVR